MKDAILLRDKIPISRKPQIAKKAKSQALSYKIKDNNPLATVSTNLSTPPKRLQRHPQMADQAGPTSSMIQARRTPE